MIISYIIHANAAGAELFADDYPTIFQLQDLIENAWDHGHNSHGRLETGGIKGTRKFIGTPEVRNVQHSVGRVINLQAGSSIVLWVGNKVTASSQYQVEPTLITYRCTSRAFRDQNPGRAATLMLECVSGYFSQGVDKRKEKKVHRTCLAPVYFQHQGTLIVLCQCM